MKQFAYYRMLSLTADYLYLSVNSPTSFLIHSHKSNQLSLFADPAFVKAERIKVAPAIALEMLAEIERRIQERKGA